MAHFGLTECLANDNVVIASLLYLILIKYEVIRVLLTQPNQQLDKEHLDSSPVPSAIKGHCLQTVKLILNICTFVLFWFYLWKFK